jgi:hypothetical protein
MGRDHGASAGIADARSSLGLPQQLHKARASVERRAGILDGQGNLIGDGRKGRHSISFDILLLARS